MVQIGKCYKCGEFKEVRQHHYKGYGAEETVPYCRSCDYKAASVAQSIDQELRSRYDNGR